MGSGNLRLHLHTSIASRMAQIPEYLLINSQKATTLFFCLYCMWRFDNLSRTAWVYTALHGSYGYCWMIKESAFANKKFRRPLPTQVAVVVALVIFLPGYWNICILALSNKEEASGGLLFAAVFVYVIGLVCMMTSDCQTHFCLKYNPGLLIAEGMTRYTRHPNYAGELLLYSSFCLLARHWAAWVILVCGYASLMLPSISRKERSLSRYPAWQEYKKQTFTYVPNFCAAASGAELSKELMSQGKSPKELRRGQAQSKEPQQRPDKKE